MPCDRLTPICMPAASYTLSQVMLPSQRAVPECLGIGGRAWGQGLTRVWCAASNLSVGFSLQNGTGYNNMVSTGQSTLFPQGSRTGSLVSQSLAVAT